MRQLGSTDLKRLHRTWRRDTSGRLGLVLAGVVQPFNVGAILRTAAAYRVEHVWLTGETPGPDDAKVSRTALGSERYVQLHRTADATTALTAAGDAGYTTVGLELADEAVPLHAFVPTGDVALVVGHEDRGLSSAVLEGCDTVAFVPQLGRIGSLNVATATAIALYEMRRKAWTGSTDA